MSWAGCALPNVPVRIFDMRHLPTTDNLYLQGRGE